MSSHQMIVCEENDWFKQIVPIINIDDERTESEQQTVGLEQTKEHPTYADGGFLQSVRILMRFGR